MDCGICIEPMKTNSFEHPSLENDNNDKIDEKDKNCLRLKCGHAFHTECMVMAFRQQFGCPVCREETTPKNVLTLDLNLGLNDLLPGNYTYEFENSNEELINSALAIQENPVFKDIENKLNYLRTTNYYVKKCRQNQNIILKEYNQFCNELQKERSNYIKDCLKKFRRDFRSKYNKKLRSLKEWMEETKKVEIFYLINELNMNEEDVTDFITHFGRYFYDPMFLPRSTFRENPDPAHLRFWFH